MADFRKWVLALAVLAFVIAPAFAQTTPFSCSANTGAGVPVIRSEGITELVGELRLNCTGGPATATSGLYNVQVQLGGGGGAVNVTSKHLSGAFVEALLIIEGDGGTATPITGTLRPYSIADGSLGNTIEWNNVTIPTYVPAGSAARLIRIVNVRVDAASVPTSLTGLQPTVSEFISITPANIATTTQIPIVNPQLIVATVLKGLATAVATQYQPVSLSGVVTSVQQCVGFNDIIATATLTENFGTAFKVRGVDVPTLDSLNLNEMQANAESGLVPVAGSSIGFATTGTKLFLTLAGIPSGITSITVPSIITNSTLTAVLTTASAASVYDPTFTTAAQYGTSAATKLSISSSGTATVVYEVVLSTGSVESLPVPFTLNLAANVDFGNLPTAPVTIIGGFAPLSTIEGSVTESTAPIPRFKDQAPPTQNLFSISACVTNLLFPYVVNAGGFDTGIAIVNTSDSTGVFNNTKQHGTCTLYYYGAMGNGNTVVAPQTTADIAAGKMVAFTIQGGGVPGATESAQTFSGYVIARCNFQFAHGFAFVSDIGVNRVAHGYLALIIPDRGGLTRLAQSFTVGAGSNQGEQLGY